MATWNRAIMFEEEILVEGAREAPGRGISGRSISAASAVSSPMPRGPVRLMSWWWGWLP